MIDFDGPNADPARATYSFELFFGYPIVQRNTNKMTEKHTLRSIREPFRSTNIKVKRMFILKRIFVAIFAFLIGLVTVWATQSFIPGFEMLGASLVQSQVINVEAPPVPQPPTVRFKRYGTHPHCRKFKQHQSK